MGWLPPCSLVVEKREKSAVHFGSMRAPVRSCSRKENVAVQFG